MKTNLLLLATLPLIFMCGCSKSGANSGQAEKEMPDTLVGDYDESEMDKAIAKAKSTIDKFIEVLNSGDAEYFSVKAPITDDNGTEHFWIVDVSYSDGKFDGKIGNDPGIVENVKYDDPYTVKKDGISDWMFVRGEKIHGGYTIEALLDSMPEAEAEAMRARLVR